MTSNATIEKHVRLDDCYAKLEGRVYMHGLQALARLPMAQMRRDRQAGLKTSAFISGYRGSPLAVFDKTLLAADAYLQQYDIHFKPAINEEMAATMAWGTQQLHLSPGANRDGVVSLWYGKGPGVDRCGDVFKHANAAGTSKHGGVLCLAGDDHGAKSSTMPHQSDHAFMSALIPMLYPSSIYEFIRYGLLGIAMSRYSGCWIGMKLLSDTVESAAAVDLADETRKFIIPDDIELPRDGVNLRWPDDRHAQSHRLQNYKPFAALAFARANKVDYVAIDSPHAQFGIIASGKSYEDVRQALRELGLNAAIAAEIGVRVYKVGMPWPLEPVGVRNFCEGLSEVLVVEERREIIENQVKQQLFNWRADVRPRIVGKTDEKDNHILPLNEELDVMFLAELIGKRILNLSLPEDKRKLVKRKVAEISKIQKTITAYKPDIVRTPYFCSGCPHNTSTKLPEGSRAFGGIGCHFMVQWMGRETDTFSHMGGEGISWLGMAPFTDEPHIFANLGDGTYYHSGILAIRQAVASGDNITYKILYNDAVAMTGGQAVDGHMTIPQMLRQLQAEGVAKIILVSDNPLEFKGQDIPADVPIYHRETLFPVMEELRKTEGCSVMLYHQTCAAEKRRMRKRGTYPQGPRRLYIHPEICENCGDCSVQSNCVSVEPVETANGRKRQINQASCNMDYSCAEGFCPSFVSLEGASMKGREPKSLPNFASLPEPEVVDSDAVVNIAVSGIGGTGVLTVGNIIGMAAHLQGKAFMALDISGLAQKGGAVLSHVRLGPSPDQVATAKIAAGGADLLLSADNIVSTGRDVRALCHPKKTYGVLSDHLTPVMEFIHDADFDFRERKVARMVEGFLRPAPFVTDFQYWAQQLLGDSIYANMMMLGAAAQTGRLGVEVAALQEAIRINGVAVEENLSAFRWGRLLVHDMAACREYVLPKEEISRPKNFDELVFSRYEDLRAYHNRFYAKAYVQFMREVREGAEERLSSEKRVQEFCMVVAEQYYKLLAFKDEFEVARQLTSREFRADLAEQFEGKYKLSFHLSPPLWASMDKARGRPKKYRYGGWIVPFLYILSGLRFLRFSSFNVFGWTAERRWEEQLGHDYRNCIRGMLSRLGDNNIALALKIADYPSGIRGFGFIKRGNWERVMGELRELLDEFERSDNKADEKLAA